MWFTATSVTVANNSNVVKINSNESVANIKPGDALIIGSFNPVEILKAYASDQGSFIQLVQTWANATQSQVPALVLPTRSALNEAISALNGANKLVNDNYQAILDWQTKMGSVTFKDLDDNTHVVKTLNQLKTEIEVNNPYPHAMTEVQYEALRAERKARYKSSGFVQTGLSHPLSDFRVADGIGAFGQNRLCLGPATTTPIGDSKSTLPQVVIDGCLFSIEYVNSNNMLDNNIYFPDAPNGKQTFDSNTGLLVEHSSATLAFAAETDTNKVILTRKDTVFLVKKHHIINETDIVYPLSNANYGRADYLGIPTFAYQKGRVHYWSQLSVEQRNNYLSEAKNNIRRLSDGRLKQEYYEFIVVAGVGSDWLGNGALSGGTGHAPWLARYCGYGTRGSAWLYLDAQDFTFKLTVSAQQSLLFSQHASSANENTSADVGLFANSDRSVCVIPVAQVDRLNQGAFNLELNAYGTQFSAEANLGAQVYFYNVINKYLSHAECFERLPATSSGNISSTSSGRLGDYRYHDAIYKGQVHDLRLNLSQTDKLITLKNATRLAIKGLMRGKQKQLFTQFTALDVIYFSGFNPWNVHFKNQSNGQGEHVDFDSYGFTLSDGIMVWQPSTGYVGYGSIYAVGIPGHLSLHQNQTGLTLSLGGNVIGGYVGNLNATDPCYIAKVKELPAEFDDLPCVDLVGLPSNIRGVYPNGCLGRWVPSLDDGRKKLNKKATKNTAVRVVWTTNGGTSFNVGTQGYDMISNTIDPWLTSNNAVALLFYEARSKFTFPMNNMAIVAAGDVYACSDHNVVFGNRLVESLIDKFATDSSAYILESLTLTHYFTDFTDYLADYSAPIHAPFKSQSSNSQGVGVKSLISLMEFNGLLYLSFRGAEIVNNGANWGDDSKINVIHQESTKTDLNGNKVKVFCHRSIFPVGVA